MLNALPVQEAQWLLDQGIQPGSNCASKSIGYCQAMTYLQRCSQDPSLVSAPALVSLPLSLAMHMSACAFMPS